MTRSDFDIDILDQQTAISVDTDQIRMVIEQVLSEERVPSAEISVALVNDAEIHKVNLEFLGHDHATDVISFLLTSDSAASSLPGIDRASFPPGSHAACHLEAELVISTETALREAGGHGWTAADELLLYVVHGMLHLCGYDDLTDEARPIMRDRERKLLAHWQLIPVGLEA